VVAAAPQISAPLTLGVLATAAAWSDPLAGVAVDVAIPRGQWLAAFDLGAGKLMGDTLGLFDLVLRAGGGLRGDWIDVRVGLTVVPLMVTTGVGDQTVLVGGGASVRVRVPLTRTTRLVAALGVDAFATRTEYEIGAEMIATPWLMPWLGVGIEVAP
jgi:hypothetical protein